MEIPCVLNMVTALWVYPYIKIYQTVRFKYVQFMICQLHVYKVVFKKQAILQGQFAESFLGVGFTVVTSWPSELH